MNRSKPGDPPTVKQQKLLDYLRQYHREHGYSPTFREIATWFNWASTNAVADMVGRLEEKGLVRRNKFCPRTLTILEPGT